MVVRVCEVRREHRGRRCPQARARVAERVRSERGRARAQARCAVVGERVIYACGRHAERVGARPVSEGDTRVSRRGARLRLELGTCNRPAPRPSMCAAARPCRCMYRWGECTHTAPPRPRVTWGTRLRRELWVWVPARALRGAMVGVRHVRLGFTDTVMCPVPVPVSPSGPSPEGSVCGGVFCTPGDRQPCLRLSEQLGGHRSVSPGLPRGHSCGTTETHTHSLFAQWETTLSPPILWDLCVL